GVLAPGRYSTLSLSAPGVLTALLIQTSFGEGIARNPYPALERAIHRPVRRVQSVASTLSSVTSGTAASPTAISPTPNPSHSENVDGLPPRKPLLPPASMKSWRAAPIRKPTPAANISVRSSNQPATTASRPSTIATTSPTAPIWTSWKVPCTNTNTALTMDTTPSTSAARSNLSCALMTLAPAIAPTPTGSPANSDATDHLDPRTGQQPWRRVPCPPTASRDMTNTTPAAHSVPTT